MHRHFERHDWDYRSPDVENATKVFFSPAQLSNHVVARARMSLIAGVDLALLKANEEEFRKVALVSKPGPWAALVSKSGAWSQDDRGRKKAGTCAAHALPCGIRIDNTPLQELKCFEGLFALRRFIDAPYRYTNIVPIAVNVADTLAEAYGRGIGLVASFVAFCSKVLESGASSAGKLDRVGLEKAFVELTSKYQESFKIALSGQKPLTSFNFQPGLPRTPEECEEDLIREALRAGERTLKESLPLYSVALVEQCENDYHSAKRQDNSRS